MSLLEEFLKIVRLHLPVVDRVIEQHGHTALGDYLRSFFQEPTPSLQGKDDLLEVLKQLAEPLLGTTIADRAGRDLAKFPVILTANHNGVDCISQSFQASLIFSLNVLQGALSSKTICVFSCGNIPLNNYEYPRGLLLYHLHPERDGLTIRFPIFPDRLKRSMVSVTPGFDEAMIARAELLCDSMRRTGRVPQRLADTLYKLLHQDYADPSVLALPSFSEQSVVLNHRIWKRVFNESTAAPELINVEIERIVAALLEFDLFNTQSLAWCVMFDPQLRESVLLELDGKRGCWQLDKLAGCSFKNVQTARQGLGTVFFWGVDGCKRRVPLHLKLTGLAPATLSGIDDQGALFQLPFTPQSLLESLRSRRLLPSLFTCFLTLSFARGFTCVGGYFQGGYLPAMQQGLLQALDKTAGYKDVSRFVAQVPTDRYLSAIAAVLAGADEYHLIPAGPIEIMAGGGIKGEDIERMLQITVREAHLAGLFETAPDGVPSQLRPQGWEKRLARECSELLRNKVAVK
ncbi:MAG: hypothetical protein RBS57_01085 [Desulforhabdus sp.]|nr:hypothetical protein [Desulforhabdus sp.]